MRPATILFLALTLSYPAQAQTAPEAQILQRLIEVMCIELIDTRSGCEMAVLLQSEDDPDTADLMIYSNRLASAPPESLSITRNIAFSGPFFGQSPSLTQGDMGALLLHSEQTAVGRMPWTQTLTIVHRDEGFLVAGLSYSTYDRPAGGAFSCDVDFLTGDWSTSADRLDPETGATTYDISHQGQIDSAHYVLDQWSYLTALPAPCETAIAAWFDASEP